MSLYRNSIRRVMIAVNVIDGVYDIAAKRIGIKENTLALFYALDDGKEHSQKEICEEWLIPKTTLNTIVKECTEAGFLVLRSDPHKKEKSLLLTEKGLLYAKSVLAPVYEMEERAMSRTLEASPEFAEGLCAFAANLKKEAEELFE